MITPVLVSDRDLAPSLVRLLESLRADDLPRIAAAGRGLGAVHDMLARALGSAPAPDATDAEVARERYVSLYDRIEAQDVLLDRVAEEVAKLHALVEGMGDRILAQAELLAKRAEGPAVEAAVATLAADPARVAGLAERLESADLVGATPVAQGVDEPEPWFPVAPAKPTAPAPPVSPPPDPAPPPPPVNIGGRLHDRRLQVCRLLAVGPLHTASICEKVDIPKGSISEVMAHCVYFAKEGGRVSPWALTDAGREALAAAGYVRVIEKPEVVIKSAESVIKSPETVLRNPESVLTEADPPRPDLSAAERAEAQCRLVAAAIAAAPDKRLAPQEIARAAGLPLTLVQTRLMKQGPQAPTGAHRYFLREDSGLYRLTNAGFDLAQREAAQ